MKPRSAVALGGLALLAAACGAVDPAAVVRQATESRSPSRCDLYTDAFFARQAGTSPAAGRIYCRQVAATLPTVKAQIGRASVHGNTATVTAAANGRTVVYRLIRQNGTWRIDSLTG
jgi:hypothetical protein